MAIKLAIGKGNIEVVASCDSVIGENADFNAYFESFKPGMKGRGDESKLDLTGEPTRFLLARNIPYEGVMAVKDRQLTFEKGKDPKVNQSYMLEEIRFALVGIDNPPDTPEEEKIVFTKDADGFAAKELISALESAKIVSELYVFRNAVVVPASGELKKK